MYFVKFTPARVVEFSDPSQFESRARRFLYARETENTCLLGIMPQILKKTIPSIPFTIEEDGTISGAGVALPATSSLLLTWLTHEGVNALVAHTKAANWKIAQVFGPAHSSHFYARDYAQSIGQTYKFDRAERVYQLTRVAHQLPADGHLQVAVEADLPLLSRWMQSFVNEAHYESAGQTADQLTRDLMGNGQLYFWKSPRAVSMAGWVCATANGASINYVYTPPELRGRGYAKAVTAALAGQMLASGVKYCAIRTDSDDAQSNAMYQAIGAQTVAEFARCTIEPRVADRPRELTAQSKPMVLL